MMYKKRKRLAMNRENFAEIDVIEIKRFNWFCDGQGREKKEGGNWGKSTASYWKHI